MNESSIEFLAGLVFAVVGTMCGVAAYFINSAMNTLDRMLSFWWFSAGLLSWDITLLFAMLSLYSICCGLWTWFNYER